MNSVMCSMMVFLQAAERLTTNIESSPSTSQPAAATAATDNAPGRFQRELSTLFPHHFQPTGSCSATPDILKAFLTFVTGAPCLPEFGLGRIRIEFEDAGSIFSSTCTKNVTLPRNFPDKDTFLAALQAVCDNSGKAFTSI